jgi:heme exporter protein B
MFSFILSTIKKEIIIIYRYPSQLINSVFFFLLVVMLFPFTMRPDPSKLLSIGPSIIWIALLFTIMLSIDRIFWDDFEDGTLEQWILNPQSLILYIAGKLITHWLATALPMMIASMLISKILLTTLHASIILLLTILLGSPILILLGALASALTLGLKNRGILLIVLVLPLYVPILIFAAGAANDAILHLPTTSHLAFLGALFSLSITFIPFTIAASLKLALE